MIAACLKWTADPRSPGDERYAGVSAADEAALEMALRQGEHAGDHVLAITVGPPAAESALRQAIACGASLAVHAVTSDEQPESLAVARALADELADARCVWCGDQSTDRGSGSVPAFLAALLGRPQALGVTTVELAGEGVRATRRLDGGRREVLGCPPGGVLSVEGAAARLRRASLPASLAAAEAHVSRRSIAVAPAAAIVHAYRPRARTLDAPRGGRPLDRLHELLYGGAPAKHGETVTGEPPQMARQILDRLAGWGYIGALPQGQH